MKASISVVFLAGLASCSHPSSEPVRGRQDDWRSQLVGTWTVEFRLDSVRAVSPAQSWKPGSFKTTTGTFVLRDTMATGSGAVGSSIDVSFDSLLGRPMSCYDPRPTSTGLDQDGETVRLTFTPNVADCGFSAYGKFFGDSVVGAWDETSFGGPTAMGRFRMIRSAQ